MSEGGIVAAARSIVMQVAGVEPPAARPGLRRPLRRRSPKAVGVGRSRHLLRPNTSRKSSGPGTFFQARVTTRQSGLLVGMTA